MESSSLQKLPEEILLYILRFLNPKSLCQLQQTSKQFKRLCNDNTLWHNLIYRYLWWEMFQQTDPNYSPTRAPTCNWREIFKQEHISTRQWHQGQVRYHIVSFSQHGGWVRCLRFNHQRLYTGSHDCTVHIHNLSTHEWIATVKGHEAGVQCLQLISDEVHNKDILFTGSSDGTVRYLTLDYNHLPNTSPRKKKLQRNIFKSKIFHNYGENGNISIKSMLAIPEEDLLVVGSEQLDLFKISSNKLIKHFTIEKGCRANALQANENYLYVALNNGTLLIIDLNSGQKIDSIVAHNAFFESFKTYRNVGLSAAADSTVKLWDLRTLNKNSSPLSLYHFPKDRTIIGIQCDNYKLVCGGTSSVLYMCDLRKHEIVDSIPTDLSELDGTILDLQFDETQIIVGGQDPRTFAFKVSPLLKHRVFNGHSPRFHNTE